MEYMFPNDNGTQTDMTWGAAKNTADGPGIHDGKRDTWADVTVIWRKKKKKKKHLF